MSTTRHFIFQTLRHTRRFSSISPPPPPPPPKIPAKLKRYAALFADKPVSYVTSFLILHELTAIVPVGGLFWYMHSTSWTPPGLPAGLVEEKMAGLRRWTQKKGWNWFQGDMGARVLLELGTAYAAVKVMMPLRMAVSIAAAPWFARLVVEPARAYGRRRWKGIVGGVAASAGVFMCVRHWCRQKEAAAASVNLTDGEL